jgi:hypothetical protein
LDDEMKKLRPRKNSIGKSVLIDAPDFLPLDTGTLSPSTDPHHGRVLTNTHTHTQMPLPFRHVCAGVGLPRKMRTPAERKLKSPFERRPPPQLRPAALLAMTSFWT